MTSTYVTLVFKKISLILIKDETHKDMNVIIHLSIMEEQNMLKHGKVNKNYTMAIRGASTRNS